MDKEFLHKLASENESPVLIMDHAQIRKNYEEFRKRLPRVQIYYAIKANCEPQILKTLYRLGSSFDVASLSEFNLIFDMVKSLEPRELQNFIWNNIIYANPVKKPDSLHFLNLYKPLLTYDSYEEMQKIKIHCPEAGLLLRIKISDEGSVVKFSNKFGIEPQNAADLIIETIKQGLGVEGISFHAGSQCNNPENFINALQTIAKIFNEVEGRGYQIGETVTSSIPKKIIDIGGGFPVQYNGCEQSFEELADAINTTLDRLFPKDRTTVLAEPGRFIVANAGTLVCSVILAKHRASPPAYHLDDGVYHTFSAVMYDHFEPDLESFKDGEKEECKVFGPTCDGLDELSENSYIHNTHKIFLPKLSEGDLVFQKNIGAYSTASSTSFNGMPSAKVVHVNV